MKTVLLLTLVFSSFTAQAANTVIFCRTSAPGWSFEFDGIQRKPQYLVVHAPLNKNYFFSPTTTGDVFKTDQYIYDGNKLEIFPNTRAFPEGVVLLATQCDV